VKNGTGTSEAKDPKLAATDKAPVPIERLTFDGSAPYSALEAAIHLNRYLVVRGLCRGRRVLDIACGEGYGSFLMTDVWGASSVAGVDISHEAIDNARRLFGSPRIEYFQQAAEQVDQLFEPASFDLVVSLETIEHLADPRPVLEKIRRLLKPDGIIVISCPNDNWYYRGENDKNPFHQRKYTFQEFVDLTEGILGTTKAFMLGTPTHGFVNVPAHRSGLALRGEGDPKAITSSQDMTFSLLAPHEEISSAECSYFVAIWGPVEPAMLMGEGAVFPLTMSSSGGAAQAEHINNLRDEVRAIADQRDQQARERDKEARERERERRHQGLRLEALKAENTQLRTACENAVRELSYVRSVLDQEWARNAELTQKLAGLQPSVIPLKDYVLFSRDFVRAKWPGLPRRIGNLARRAARKAVGRVIG